MKVIHPKVQLHNFIGIYQVLSEILQNEILMVLTAKCYRYIPSTFRDITESNFILRILEKQINNKCHFLFYITQHTKIQKLDFDEKLNISKIIIGH